VSQDRLAEIDAQLAGMKRSRLEDRTAAIKDFWRAAGLVALSILAETLATRVSWLIWPGLIPLRAGSLFVSRESARLFRWKGTNWVRRQLESERETLLGSVRK